MSANIIFVYADSRKLNDREFSPDIQAELIESEHIIKTEEEILDAPIRCFDISDSGYIAVGLKSNNINIYNADGSYLYSYSFIESGDYMIVWDNGDLIIFAERGDINYCISADGITASEATEKREYGNSKIDYMNSTHKQWNGRDYILSKNIKPYNTIAPYYSTLKCIDNLGNEKIILDTGNSYRSQIQEKIIMRAFMLVAAIIFLVINYFSKKYSEDD